ncbi:hypothetical protein [Ktedonobacter robiniae]|uniref:Uncharacterized protein n=1 Tax=Ktedonobacter robiniae TaxID=2778365 RepID=A0ABQ3UTW6_9CHLR|nr:hypothetical protein [Ktedonobacter robiniae]GHO56139.1 hypothetical protein KSB_46140 [Ktedonobacter robiniae]
MKRIALIGLLAALALTVLLFVTIANPQNASGSGSHGPKGFTPPAHTISAGHMKGIPVASNKLQANNNALPTFTASDVEAYLKTNPYPVGEKSKLKHIITFMSSSDLGKKVNADFSAEAPTLCYVEFTDTQPIQLDTVAKPNGQLLSFKKVYMIFDGRTGDLITWGGN